MVVIAPHPDDEVFGCGGMITLATARQKKVHVVVLTGGENSHKGCCELSADSIKTSRRQLTMNAAAKLGLPEESIIFLNWPDGGIPCQRQEDFIEYANQLQEIIESLNPDTVFTPHPFEGWSDHIAAQQITRAAVKQSSINCRVFYYCVWFWFSMPLRRAFRCDWKRASVLDISDVHRQKLFAINEYMKPVAPCGKPWSGVLPQEFLWAQKWNKELYFEVKAI